MPGKFKFWILMSLFIFCNNKVFAQKGQPFMLGLNFHHGFIYNHSSKSGVQGPSLTSVEAIEATMQWQTLGTKGWHHRFNYPRWGVSFIWLDLKQKTYGGSAAAIIIHQSIRLVYTSFFEFDIRLGGGIGYVSDLYDPVESPNNIWISMNPNAVMQLGFETSYKISSRLQLIGGANFTHFSNGNLSKPNLGLNIPTLNIGLRYTPSPEKIKFVPDSSHDTYKKKFLHISVAFGIKSVYYTFPNFYPTYNISIQYGRRINRRSKMLIGIDGFQDNSLYEEEEYQAHPANIQRLGIFGAHEFVFGKMGFVTGAGYYLYNNFLKRDGNVYFRIGLRYQVSKHLFGMLNLKAHGITADCFEWTLGYTL